MSNNQSFIKLYSDSFRENWLHSALTDYKGQSHTYGDVASKIAQLHLFYEMSGIKKGDHIAICGRNSSNWGISFLSVVTYGAVAVPILNDFKEDNVHHIVNDSDSRLLFAGKSNLDNLDSNEMPQLEGIIRIEDFSLAMSRTEEIKNAHANIEKAFNEKYPGGFTSADIKYHTDSPEELAIINYTSGTSGFSKGVLIPYRALYNNMMFGKEALCMKPGMTMLSILPMAHMYGMAFEFLYELTCGVQIFFLTRTPSPRIIFDAFSKVRPIAVVAVPLIIEKIIRKSVMPKLQKPIMKIATKIPGINNIIYGKIRKRMLKAFGGNVTTVIAGGAACSTEIDALLHRLKFPFTVGYGATECAPIICYSDWKVAKVGSCGRPALNMEVKILSNDPENVPGEIIVRGPNVMLGYYKNTEATEQALDKEGWYHTRDMGIIDKDGYLFIKGRCKSMLLGANGQNIYPEEIEARLNEMPFVAESLVIQEGEKFIGLVYPNHDALQEAGITREQLPAKMEEVRKMLNQQIPSYEHISTIRIMSEEFEKTPKKSIKRYLYQ
ncbi:MAG: AMP-binding protein [Bacteroidaceae bacterium]|nr:AMP-binding protein [Bacteroidaceae bacterium]